VNLREEQALIAGWIAPGSRVLDLGCGDGSLLAHLKLERNVASYGIEIDSENIVNCIASGVNVIHSDLDRGLSDFDDDSFDYVVMTQTLQAVRYPNRLLREMLRVGREGIVTFPNFGHWRCRLQVLAGRMPVTRHLPSTWFDTQNIHSNASRSCSMRRSTPRTARRSRCACCRTSSAKSPSTVSAVAPERRAPRRAHGSRPA
jgi:methionine biosynthesis protein MetW